MRVEHGASDASSRAADAVLLGMGGEPLRTARRPSIPPVAVCALSLWLSCAGAYLVAAGAVPEVCRSAAFACVLASAVAGTVGLRMSRGGGVARAIWAGGLGVLLGATCAFAAAFSLHSAAAQAVGKSYGPLEVQAVEDASSSDFGSSVKAIARLPSGERYTVLAYFSSGDPILRFGDRIVVRGALEAPEGPSAARLWQQGCSATLSCDVADCASLSSSSFPPIAFRNAAIDAMLSGPGGDRGKGALAALVCGYRCALDESGVYESFQLSGLAHVIAVSGSHLSIVAGVVAFALGAVSAGRRVAASAHVFLVLSYLAVCGMPVSAVRSAIMASCGVASVLAWRRSASLNALSVCVIAMICFDPACAVSVSFALSAASTATIVLFSGLFARWANDLFGRRVPSAFSEPISLTLAASIGSQPLSCAIFSQLPLVSPLSNLIATPLFTVGCIVGLAAAVVSVVTPALSWPFLAAAVVVVEVLCEAAVVLSQVPYACVPAHLGVPLAVALTVGVSVALWAWWPAFRPRKAAWAVCALAIVAAAAFLVSPFFWRDEIVALDVGQGDAVLVKSRGQAMLVDTGNQDGLLSAALARHGIVRLDAVLVTHSDDDHCGSLSALAGVVEIGRVLLARDALSCECGSCSALVARATKAVGEQSVVGLSVGDEISVGSFEFEVVWPDAYSDEGGNADSLCLAGHIDCDGDGSSDVRALLVGDAEAEQLSEMVALGRAGEVDVYKVGHHGSAAAIDERLARKLSPAVSLVSVGAGNRFGHPAPNTLEALKRAGSIIVRTDESGDVSCSFTAEGVVVRTMR